MSIIFDRSATLPSIELFCSNIEAVGSILFPAFPGYPGFLESLGALGSKGLANFTICFAAGIVNGGAPPGGDTRTDPGEPMCGGAALDPGGATSTDPVEDMCGGAALDPGGATSTDPGEHM